MQAVVIILEVLVAVLAMAGLARGGRRMRCGAVSSFEDADIDIQIMGTSLLSAVPSYPPTRALRRTLIRRQDVAAEAVAATVSAASGPNGPASSRVDP